MPSSVCTPTLHRLHTVTCQALFRLHADAEDDDGEGGDGGGGATRGGSGEAWLDSLTDAQLIGAQRAFHASLKGAVDYAEAIRTEAAEVAAAAGAAQEGAVPTPEVDGGAHPAEPAEAGTGMAHPLLLPIARCAFTRHAACPRTVDASSL